MLPQGGKQQAKPVAAKPEDEVLTTQRQSVAAMGNKDVAALERIVAEDFVGVGAGGHAAGKSAMLSFHEGPTSFAFVRMEDPMVRIFDGSTAVVLGLWNNFDVDRHETVRFAMVYRKRANGWQLVAGQLVPTPAE